MKYLTLWALLCILFGCGGTSQEEPPKKPSKIIFGYLQYEQLPEYQIPWDQLTHLSIAFGRATEEGGLADAANIKKLLPIFREGQKKGVKVLLSADADTYADRKRVSLSSLKRTTSLPPAFADWKLPRLFR